jgi:hypothetical protein
MLYLSQALPVLRRPKIAILIALPQASYICCRHERAWRLHGARWRLPVQALAGLLARGQQTGKFCAGSDAEFAIGAREVGFHGLVGDE